MIAFAILLVTIIVIAGFLISIYNELAKERILVEEGWSGIGVHLQQRLDLIPNMVEVVKGYAGHENKTLTDVIKARNESIAALTPEAQIEAAKNLGSAMLNFKQLTEQYPQITANPNFRELQTTLGVIEDKINLSRRYYNGTVREYNQSIAIFPKNMVAGMFGYQAKPFFAEDAAAQTAPKISFS